MNPLAFIFNLLGLIAMILASVIGGEKMKRILVLVFCGNLFVGLSYLCNGSGIEGGASCFLGAVQSVISYFFQAKRKPLPKWLIALYALSFVVVNIAVAGGSSISFTDQRMNLLIGLSIPTAVAIFATLAFVMGIIQSRGVMYRFWTIMNMLLWGVYDVVAPEFQLWPFVTHVVLFVFTVAGMIIHDRKALRSAKKQ